MISLRPYAANIVDCDDWRKAFGPVGLTFADKADYDKINEDESELIEVAAEKLYNTHWGIQISGGYPTCWVDLSEEFKEFVRKQAKNVIEAVDEFRNSGA